MYPDLEGKVAIVTGASSGIGRAIAERFGKEKMKVIIHYNRDGAQAREVARAVEQSGGQTVIAEADIRSEEAVGKLVRTAVEAFGTVDVMVNNAGVESTVPSHELSLSEWNRVIDINLTGTFLGAREAIKVMRAHQTNGTIINVSSVHQKIPKPQHVHYASSKGGMRLLTESLAAEYAHLGIRVNAIAPGAVRTRMNQHLLDDPAVKNDILHLIPMRTIGDPAQISAAAAWLASEESSYVTGITLFADGGMTLYPTYVKVND